MRSLRTVSLEYVLSIAFAFVAFGSASHAYAQDPSLAIVDVAVVDVETGSVRGHQTVSIENGRIRAVGADVTAPRGGETLDGRGKFLLPGLWDMHVHVRSSAAREFLFPLFIAHGVTGVRDMASDCRQPRPGETCAEELKRWSREIETGELVGPRLLALSSFPLNPPWEAQIAEQEARSLVREIASRGVDLIKIYYRLSPEAFHWIVDEAAKVDLSVSGHIPIRMTAIEVANAGLTSLEHARDFLFDCFPGAAEFRRTTSSQNPAMTVMRSMVDDHDAARCDDVFRAFIRNGTWYVPTHVTRRMDAFADDPDFRDDPRKKYLPAELWDAWQRDADGMIALDPTPEGRRVMRGFYEKGLSITGRAHRAGVPIVLGTDAGDTYVFPGSGVHDELGELVKAGLSPADALAAATIRTAEFLSLEGDYGTVAVGKRADLILLTDNPLENIDATRKVDVVVFGGRAIRRAELDELLVGVENWIRDQSAPR